MRIIKLPLIVLLAFAVSNLKAQSCNPNAPVGLPVFGDTTPCIVQGQSYYAILSFRNYDTTRIAGNLITIDSIKIDTISNLPCGIVWTPNNANRTYSNSEVGCIMLSGTTNDPIGQYQLNVAFTAYIGGAPLAYNYSGFGFKSIVRVKAAQGAACPVIDTTLTSQTASCATPMPTTGFGNTGGHSNSCAGMSSLTSPGLYPVDQNTIPCIIKGQPYGYTLYLKNFDQATAFGQTVTVDSVRIDSLINAPCGIFWSVSSNMFYPLETGCITLSGTTNDSLGQYHLDFAVTAYIAGLPVQHQHYSNMITAPYLRVVDTMSNCLPVDTTAGSLTSSCTSSPGIFGNIWPGDADNNGAVDANDALQIGIEYGSTGPTRQNPTIQWVGQVCNNWGGVTYGINDKYADCDGNGIINVNDTLAVAQNYNLTHNKAGQKASSIDPVLSLVPVEDTVTAAGAFHVKVMLGSSGNPVDSLYGLAFSMNLDPSIFDTSAIQFNASGSWLGSQGSNLFTFRKSVTAQGRLDAVIARTDHQNIGGYGEIGELVLRGNSHITSSDANVTLTPTVIKGITATGMQRIFNTQGGQAVVDAIDEPKLDNLVTLYPNPNNGRFTLTIDQPSKSLAIQLTNAQGQEVYAEQLKDQASTTKTFDLGNLPKGIYILKVNMDKGNVVKRVMVQ